MNRLQYLLIKLAEEGAEVSQIALKTAQFGLYEQHPNLEETNLERIQKELNDLFGIVEMLNTEFGCNLFENSILVKEKIHKVNHYAKYSEELGLLQQ